MHKSRKTPGSSSPPPAPKEGKATKGRKTEKEDARVHVKCTPLLKGPNVTFTPSNKSGICLAFGPIELLAFNADRNTMTTKHPHKTTSDTTVRRPKNSKGRKNRFARPRIGHGKRNDWKPKERGKRKCTRRRPMFTSTRLNVKKIHKNPMLYATKMSA